MTVGDFIEKLKLYDNDFPIVFYSNYGEALTPTSIYLEDGLETGDVTGNKYSYERVAVDLSD